MNKLEIKFYIIFLKKNKQFILLTLITNFYSKN